MQHSIHKIQNIHALLVETISISGCFLGKHISKCRIFRDFIDKKALKIKK